MIYVYLIGLYLLFFTLLAGMIFSLYEPIMYCIRLIKDKLTPIEPIEIIDLYKDDGFHKMPITVEDVEGYLKEVEKICPRSLKGIEAIILKDRDVGMRPSIMACFRFGEDKKNRGIIEIYPLQYRRDKNLFAVPYTKEAYPKAILTPEEARDMQLFSLGHELGHNYFYRSIRQIKGRNLERKCDAFSEALSIAPDPMESKREVNSWEEWEELKITA